MGRELMSIACTPLDEPCVQVCPGDYIPMMNKEVTAFMNQIQRAIDRGEYGEPNGAYLRLITERHEFGPYKEVNVSYDDRSEEAEEFALAIEGNAPLKWDDEAKAELGEEYFEYINANGGGN